MAHFARLISFLVLVSGIILLTHCGDSSRRATGGPGSTPGSPGSGSGSVSGGSGSSGSGSAGSSGSSSGGSVSGGGSGSQGPTGGQSIPGFGADTGAAGQTSAAKFLYANPVPNGGPYALTIQPGGGLNAAPTANNQNPQSLASNTETMAIDPSGSFVFQTALGNTAEGGLGGILVYRIDRSTGGLSSPIGSYLSGEPVYADVVDNKGMLLYAFGSSGVSAFRIQSGTGVLTPVPGSPFQAGAPNPPGSLTANLMAVDQTDRFLYVSTISGIFAYTIDPTTGGLTAIAGSPFGADIVNPGAIVITPTNSYLYEVERSDSSKIFGYSIDQTGGVLTPLAGSPFSAGTCTGMPNAAAIGGGEPPDNMTIPSSSKFMYDVCGVYSIQESTGAIAQVASGGPGMWPVADPTGDFVWAITSDMPACFHCDIGVAAFQIDPNTGKLAEVPNSFFLLTNSFSGALGSLAITK